MASQIDPAPRPSWDRARYNELLIERGDLTFYLKKLQHWAEELEKENENKEGKKFEYPTVLFQILAIEHNYGKSYRNVEGFARTICGIFHFPAPRWSTIWYRIQNLTSVSLKKQNPSPSKSTIINGAVDSSGLKLNGPGEYLNDKHHPSKKKEYVKLHALVNTRTHQIIVKVITPGYCHDSPYFVPLVQTGVQNHRFGTIWADRAYEGHENFEILSVNQIKAGIELKKNASTRTRGGSFARSRTAWEIKKLGKEEWKKKVGYGNRWAVERTYSIYKLLFGERLQARKWSYIQQEIYLKVAQMNEYLSDLYSE